MVVPIPIGGAAAEPSLRALGDGGRYLVIGFASGAIPTIAGLNQVLLRTAPCLGIDWGVWAMRHGADQQSLLDDLLALVGDGADQPDLSDDYPLVYQVGVALDDLLARGSWEVAADPRDRPRQVRAQVRDQGSDEKADKKRVSHPLLLDIMVEPKAGGAMGQGTRDAEGRVLAAGPPRGRPRAGREATS